MVARRAGAIAWISGHRDKSSIGRCDLGRMIGGSVFHQEDLDRFQRLPANRIKGGSQKTFGVAAGDEYRNRGGSAHCRSRR